MNSSKPSRQRGGFWIRLAAFIIDYLVCLFILNGILYPLDLLLYRYEIYDFNTMDDLTFQYFMMIAMYTSLFLYFFLFQAIFKTTIGKYLAGLRIDQTNGKPASAFQVLLRTMGYGLSVFFNALGFLMIACNRNKAGLHDWIAGTEVVYQHPVSTMRKIIILIMGFLGMILLYVIMSGNGF